MTRKLELVRKNQIRRHLTRTKKKKRNPGQADKPTRTSSITKSNKRILDKKNQFLLMLLVLLLVEWN